MKVPERYISRLLVDWKLEKCKAATTPFSSAKPKLGEEDEKLDAKDHKRFRAGVGKLMWTLPARPDMAYCIKELSRKSSSPSRSDVTRLKRCLKYLKGTAKDIYLVVRKDAEAGGDIEVWTDASWVAPKSTSGCTLLDGEEEKN